MAKKKISDLSNEVPAQDPSNGPATSTPGTTPPAPESLGAALLEFQRTVAAVVKDSKNPHFKSTYADLNSVLEVVKPALNAVGILITQSGGADEFGKYLETSLELVVSGQKESSRVYFSGAEDNMQKIGAAITYARRFGLTSLLCLESVDDDGETAVGRGPTTSYAPKPAQPPAPILKPSAPAAPLQPSAQPSAATVSIPTPSGPTRDEYLKLISLRSKVLLDSKRKTQEELEAELGKFGAFKKEELSYADAATLAGVLDALLK